MCILSLVKGGYIWVVNDVTYVQCQYCGHIYRIASKVSIEDSIIESKCPRCGDMVGLNLGDKEEDIYLYMNVNIDWRYF